MRNRSRRNIDPGLYGQKALHQASEEGKLRTNERTVRQDGSGSPCKKL